jgi:peptidoglycan hydrolase-like protein with peptidoglycan-binding domain
MSQFHVLKEGDSGDDVKVVQEALNLYRCQIGLKEPLETKSGIFGPKTTAAVKAFQQYKHLEVNGQFNGVVGLETFGALFSASVFNLTLAVQKLPAENTCPVSAPRQRSVVPALAPIGPVTAQQILGMPSPLPGPITTPQDAPTSTAPAGSDPAAASQTAKKIFQIQAGPQHSIPLTTSPKPKSPTPASTTLVIDVTSVILHTGSFSHYLDAAYTSADYSQPVSNQKQSAYLYWKTSRPLDLFKHKRWDLARLSASVSARVGAGWVFGTAKPYASLGGSLSALVSYDVVPDTLSIFVKGGPSFNIDDRDVLHVSGSLGGQVGVIWTFGPSK